MSLAIRHPFAGQAVLPAAAAPRSVKAAEAESPCRTFAEEDPAQRRGLSVFHRWAAADLAARDVAFRLFLNRSRR